MRLLAEIHRHAGVNPRGRAVTREAVRSVIWRGSELLLLYSRRDGTYKFPGGGVDAGESHVQALARELREECGAELIEVLGPLGRVVEYALPKETDFDVFCMTSYYYFCSIESELGAQDLKGYELDLGLEPRWLKAEEAIAVNEQALASGTAPSRTRRETTVLKLLRDRLQKTGS